MSGWIHGLQAFVLGRLQMPLIVLLFDVFYISTESASFLGFKDLCPRLLTLSFLTHIVIRHDIYIHVA